MKKIIILFFLFPFFINAQIQNIKQLNDSISKAYNNKKIIAYEAEVYHFPFYHIYNSLTKWTIILERDTTKMLLGGNYFIADKKFINICYNDSSYYVYPKEKLNISGLEGEIFYHLTQEIFDYFFDFNKKAKENYQIENNEDSYILTKSDSTYSNMMIVDRNTYFIKSFKNIAYENNDTIIYSNYKVNYFENSENYSDTIKKYYQLALFVPDKKYEEQEIERQTLPLMTIAPQIKGLNYPDSTEFILHKLSKKTKKVIIFSSFTCSACGSHLYKLNKIIDKYPNTDFYVLYSNDTSRISNQKINEYLKFQSNDYKFKNLIVDEKYYKTYLVEGYPVTYILNEKFKIIQVINGTSTEKDLFEKFEILKK